jgi:hypothetical protein
MAETKEERRARIEKSVAERSAAREKAYFEEQAKSKTEAAAKLPPLPAPDVNVYNYSWRQGVGTPTGEFGLVKTPNPTYDPSTNTIVDPVTGERRPVVMSTYGGPTSTSDSLYDAKRAAGYGMDTAGNQYRGAGTSNNPLTINGSPFTGTWQGKTYSNGIVTTVSPTIVTGSGDTSTSANTLAAQQAAQAAAEEKRRQGQSAYSLLFSEFERYGLGALVEPLKGFIVEGLSPAEFTLRLRETDAYKKRFAANTQRINKGLRALSEAEYIGLEDQYQNIMRNYGLPASYYARGEMGVQQGFEKFIGGDVSAAELEDRIQTAQNRVLNAAPEVSKALREFYPDITNGDILAYTLDPDKALTDIRRRVTAAEIGAGAMQAGLRTGLARAEELGRFGITGEQARQGFSTIAEVLPSATKLSQIYAKQGMGPFTQETAEQEVFGITGAAEARTKRRKLAELETAAFSGTSGAAGGALGRERAGAF